MNGLDYWAFYEDGSELYLISCDGEECSVDSTMRFRVAGTAKVGTWQDGKVPEDAFPYYWYWYYEEDWKRGYLSSEGNPLHLSDGTEVFFAANRGREDYILVGRSENGTIIEEYISGVFAGRYECTVNMGEYDKVTYWAPNCFAIEGTSRLFADGKEFGRDVQIAEITEPGYLAYCQNGYLQVEGRNYIYVYDYNGDVVIKAVNVAMAEE